jgi:hypothetical protein
MQTTIATDRPRAPQPESVSVALEAGSLKIVFRWLSWKFIGLLVFCIAWDSFLLFWYSNVGENSPWIMIVFPMAHVAVGLGLTYYMFAGFLNSTIIMMNHQFLIITQTPLPWFGNRRVESAKLAQLYTEQVMIQSRNSSSSSYQLSGILRNNRKVKLLSGLPSQDVTLFVEQSIEEYLRIADEPVAGEVYKPKA